MTKPRERRVIIAVVVVVSAALVALHFTRDWLVFRAPMWLHVLLYVVGLIMLLGSAVKWVEQNGKAKAVNSQEKSDTNIKP